MSKPSVRTPSEIHSQAGRLPTSAIAIAAALATVSASAGVALAQQQGGRAGQREPMQLQVSEHETVSLHVKDEDLLAVLEMMSIQSKRNIIPSKNVGGRVTANLYDVTFYEALDAILHVNGYGYIEQGNFIYVYTLDELEQIQRAMNKRVAKVLHLNYLNAVDAAEFVKPLLSVGGAGGVGGEIKTSARAGEFNIPANAPVGKDDYALGATLVVIDYEENIVAIESLVAELDTKPAQVLIQATVLQTALNEANAFGVDFSIIGNLNFTDFIGVGGPRRAADALIAGGAGSAGQGVSPSDNRGTALSSTVGNTTGPGGFKVGVIADDISIFLRMLDEVTDTTIVSNPKLLTLNRQPARVLVGRRVGYLSTTATDTSTTQTVQFLDTGTQLNVRPFVARDNTIRMELKPQVSEAVIREATDASGASVSIPDEITQELTTNVIVRDGQTIVLGGLFRESTTLTRRQVPILGDIPIIGTAFRGHDDTVNRAEIIFLITPSIVTDSLLNEAAQRAANDIERLRAGSRQGLLPWSREKMTASLNVEAEMLARNGEYDKALWTLQRSLSLNPVQTDALRLRERISGEREVWPTRSILNESLQEEATRRLRDVQPAPAPVEHRQPWGSKDFPRERVGPPATNPPMSAAPAPTPVASAPSAPSAASPATPAGGPNSAPFKVVEPMGFVSPEDEQTAVGVNQTLETLRTRIQTYRAAHGGAMPRLGGTDPLGGWQPLVDARLIDSPPANPFVPGEFSNHVILGDGPDAFTHTAYGWIFNPATGQLFAAGLDGEGRPLAKPFAKNEYIDSVRWAQVENQVQVQSAVSEQTMPSLFSPRSMLTGLKGWFGTFDTSLLENEGGPSNFVTVPTGGDR